MGVDGRHARASFQPRPMYVAVLSEGAFRCMNGSATSSGGAASTLAGTSGTAADADDSAKPPGGGESDVGVDGRHARAS